MTNNPDNHQHRRPDGKFGPSVRAPADIDLDGGGSDDAIFEEANTTGDDLRLDELVSHEDREVRLATVVNPNLTGDHIERLARDKDWVVRWELANLPHGGIGDLLAGDEDAVVRCRVLERHGDTLDSRSKQRLTADPACRRVTSELANWS